MPCCESRRDTRGSFGKTSSKLPGLLRSVASDIRAIYRLSPTPRATRRVLEESVALHRNGDLEAVLYNRYDSPWPLKDRDFVLHRAIAIDSGLPS